MKNLIQEFQQFEQINVDHTKVQGQLKALEAEHKVIVEEAITAWTGDKKKFVEPKASAKLVAARTQFGKLDYELSKKPQRVRNAENFVASIDIAAEKQLILAKTSKLSRMQRDLVMSL